jgi:pyruvate formate lyase activating enzyme
MSAAEVLAEVERDRVFYEESDGGVTFSGGEPLLQFEFLMESLDRCRAAGLHTALDTCGAAPRERMIAAGTRADLVLFDLKCMDGERHRAATGTGNAEILGNLRALAEAGATLWLRLPLVAGFNDDDENAERTAQLAAALPGVRRLSLLPYHDLGTHKRGEGAARRERGTPSAAPAPPSAERIEELAQRYRARGLDVRIGG